MIFGRNSIFIHVVWQTLALSPTLSFSLRTHRYINAEVLIKYWWCLTTAIQWVFFFFSLFSNREMRYPPAIMSMLLIKIELSTSCRDSHAQNVRRLFSFFSLSCCFILPSQKYVLKLKKIKWLLTTKCTFFNINTLQTKDLL